MLPRDKNELLIQLDGALVPTRDAMVHVFDHSFFYGDGIFDIYRVADGPVFRMEPHLDRMERLARAIMLDLPGGRDGVRQAVLDIASPD